MRKKFYEVIGKT